MDLFNQDEKPLVKIATEFDYFQGHNEEVEKVITQIRDAVKFLKTKPTMSVNQFHKLWTLGWTINAELQLQQVQDKDLGEIIQHDDGFRIHEISKELGL